MATPAEQHVQAYLATLERASPSTRRQRAWALADLIDPASQHPQHPDRLDQPSPPSRPDPALPPARTLGELLAPERLATWIAAAAATDPPASLPGLRARASAARALARHGELTRALPPGTADGLAAALRLPAPPPAPGPDPSPVRRLLAAAHPDARPRGTHPAVWTRFCAHTHLLALTGEREDVMATLPTSAVTTTTTATAGASATATATSTSTATAVTIDAGPAPREVPLPGPARTALTAWLRDRAALTAALTGAPPAALWLRARPSHDHRTATVRPAGLPLSDRGLRLAFMTTLALLAAEDPDLATLSTAAVRSYGRGRGPAT